jgi:hypothetical protein
MPFFLLVDVETLVFSLILAIFSQQILSSLYPSASACMLMVFIWDHFVQPVAVSFLSDDQKTSCKWSVTLYYSMP